MKRFQTFFLALWAVALFLFVAFNWQLVRRVIEIDYLFMEFEVQLLLWFTVAAFAVPLVMRLLSATENSGNRKRSEKELYLAKANAYDGLSGEFTRLGEQLRVNLEGQLKNLLDSQAASAAAVASAAADAAEKALPAPEPGEKALPAPEPAEADPEEVEKKPAKRKGRRR